MRRLLQYLNIESEIEDYDRIHEVIEKDLYFRGTNLWILVFAIVVASIGLNMNSTAVIIGAMLISPLMGPINGLGYSIATYDLKLFRKAAKNFLFAVFAGLGASSVYFMISPVSTAHSELLARTSPTIYDVLIALFGGLAGILATCSKQKGNVIPGVAIATALMPPLCTAGYGLATFQLTYFMGALYLFTINAVFIGFSAVAMSQFLKFPIRSNVEPYQKKRINRWITIVLVITIIPSIYFGYNLVQKERFSSNVSKFVKSIGILENSYLMRQEINAERRSLTLIYGGNALTPEQKAFLKSTARMYSLDTASINIQQGFSINNYNPDEEEILNSEIARLSIRMKRYQDSVINKQILGQQLFVELNALYPVIGSVVYSESYIYSSTQDKAPRLTLVYLTITQPGLKKEEEDQIANWLSKRLNTNSLKVFFD